MKRESTPFAILDIKTPKNHEPVWVRFYWSANSGTYGHQVIMEYNIGDGFATYKTNGCGYCKKSAALDHFIYLLTGKSKSLGGDLHYYLQGTEYHSGGNYFKLNLDQINKIEELTK